MTMRCEVCGKTVSDLPNKKFHNLKPGVGRWVCEDHLPDDYVIDPELQALLDLIQARREAER